MTRWDEWWRASEWLNSFRPRWPIRREHLMEQMMHIVGKSPVEDYRVFVKRFATARSSRGETLSASLYYARTYLRRGTCVMGAHDRGLLMKSWCAPVHQIDLRSSRWISVSVCRGNSVARAIAEIRTMMWNSPLKFPSVTITLWRTSLVNEDWCNVSVRYRNNSKSSSNYSEEIFVLFAREMNYSIGIYSRIIFVMFKAVDKTIDFRWYASIIVDSVLVSILPRRWKGQLRVRNIIYFFRSFISNFVNTVTIGSIFVFHSLKDIGILVGINIGFYLGRDIIV